MFATVVRRITVLQHEGLGFPRLTVITTGTEFLKYKTPPPPMGGLVVLIQTCKGGLSLISLAETFIWVLLAC